MLSRAAVRQRKDADRKVLTLGAIAAIISRLFSVSASGAQEEGEEGEGKEEAEEGEGEGGEKEGLIPRFADPLVQSSCVVLLRRSELLRVLGAGESAFYSLCSPLFTLYSLLSTLYSLLFFYSLLCVTFILSFTAACRPRLHTDSSTHERKCNRVLPAR